MCWSDIRYARGVERFLRINEIAVLYPLTKQCPGAYADRLCAAVGLLMDEIESLHLVMRYAISQENMQQAEEVVRKCLREGIYLPDHLKGDNRAEIL